MDFLGGYAREHFESEEVLMKKYFYPKLDSHKKEHDDFLEKFKNLCHDLVDGGDILCVADMKYFLLEWFLHHVNHVDVGYGVHFRKCGCPCEM